MTDVVLNTSDNKIEVNGSEIEFEKIKEQLTEENEEELMEVASNVDLNDYGFDAIDPSENY